jgi:hypothetical protein
VEKVTVSLMRDITRKLKNLRRHDSLKIGQPKEQTIAVFHLQWV